MRQAGRRRWCGIRAGGWPGFPWALLGAVSAAAPIAVLAQGGGPRVAVLAAAACLASPGAAIEMMLALGRAAAWIERHGAPGRR